LNVVGAPGNVAMEPIELGTPPVQLVPTLQLELVAPVQLALTAAPVTWMSMEVLGTLKTRVAVPPPVIAVLASATVPPPWIVPL
jgi:hypothetical protein